MSLRTYPLIIHPAYIEHIAAHKFGDPSSNERAIQPPPPLERAVDIASYLGVSPDIILGILRRKHRHYRSFSIKKRDGTIRPIHAPRTFLKVVQWWILDTILIHAEPHSAAFGFVKGRSFIDNARNHIGAKHILNVDVSNFFPSLRLSDVRSVFSTIGYAAPVAAELTEIVSLLGSVPQGAPTSPHISNIIMKLIDIELEEIARSHHVKYTRYADDMTFSSQERISSDFPSLISTKIAKIGLSLNVKKTRYMGKNQSKEVTGIIVGDNEISLPRDYLNHSRSLFYRANKFPTFFDEKRSEILGTYNLIKQVSGRGSAPVLDLGREAIEKAKARRPFRDVH